VHPPTILEIVVFPLAVLVIVYLLFRMQARPIRDHPLNNPVSGIETGSAAQIADAGSIGWPSLLYALSTVPVDPGKSGRGPGPENSVAETLGLQAPTVVGRFQPNLIYGVRHGRQVFIRIGIDETYLSDFTTRHMRQITVLRVDVPDFEVVGERGVLGPESAQVEVPPPLRTLLSALRPSPDVWDGLLVVGGPEGIVASRPVPHRVRVRFQWLYDLWLVERIADLLHAPALPAARLDRSYQIPYWLGRAG
jgi:hypothetical protein